MAEKLEIYKCDLCGSIIEVMSGGGGTLVCCDQEMTLENENTVDAAKEKHVPVISMAGGVVTVKLGSVPHPMEEKHYIQWIEVIAGEKAYVQFLNPGDAPEATFAIDADPVTARAYCNLHGHWKA